MNRRYYHKPFPDQALQILRRTYFYTYMHHIMTCSVLLRQYGYVPLYLMCDAFRIDRCYLSTYDLAKPILRRQVYNLGGNKLKC